MDDSLAPLRIALRTLLGGTPTPTRRRRLALDLRALAEEQERLAEADERSGTRMRAMLARELDNQERPKGGRPKGSGGRFVRVDVPATGTLLVHIAPALYQELGEPARVMLERHERQIVMRPARGDTGYAVNRPTGARGGLPRFSIGRVAAADLGLNAGKHTAHIEDGVIVFM